MFFLKEFALVVEILFECTKLIKRLSISISICQELIRIQYIPNSTGKLSQNRNKLPNDDQTRSSPHDTHKSLKKGYVFQSMTKNAAK